MIKLYECPHCSVVMTVAKDRCPACKKKIEFPIGIYIEASTVMDD